MRSLHRMEAGREGMGWGWGSSDGGRLEGLAGYYIGIDFMHVIESFYAEGADTGGRM